MVKLHFKVKFRVFGVTVGTVEDTREIGAILQVAFPGVGLLQKGAVLYNDRGVLIELVA